jgi:hypothetical protein
MFTAETKEVRALTLETPMSNNEQKRLIAAPNQGTLFVLMDNEVLELRPNGELASRHPGLTVREANPCKGPSFFFENKLFFLTYSGSIYVYDLEDNRGKLLVNLEVLES